MYLATSATFDLPLHLCKWAECNGLWARVEHSASPCLKQSPNVWNRHISTTSRPWYRKTDNILTSVLATRWPSDSTDVSSETTGAVANHILVTPQSCISAPLPVNMTFWWLVLFGPFGICKRGKSSWKKEKTVQQTTGGKKRWINPGCWDTKTFFSPLFVLKGNASAVVTKSCSVFGHEKGGNPGSKVRILFYFSP